MHAVCRRILGDDQDAADATQDTLLLAVRSLSRFDGRSSFGTWIYRIATNACFDELRRRRRRPVVGFDDEESPKAHRSGHPAGTGSDVAAVDPAETASTRLDVDAALRTLPLEFRAAVVLRDFCDMPYEEIAQVLEVPLGTVRSRIARGRAALANLFEQSGNPGELSSVEQSMGAQRVRSEELTE